MALGKGTSGKSVTGASMSKYDVEVEARVASLEKAVKALQAESHAKCDGGGDAGLAATVAHLAKRVSDELGG